MKRKEQYNRIAFWVKITQLFILSYLTMSWKMLLYPFLEHPCFTFTMWRCSLFRTPVLVRLLMKILILFISLKDLFYNEAVMHWGVGGWGGGEKPSVLNRYLFVEKRQKKLKVHVRDASYKLKSKLVVTCRNIQHLTGTVL